jgi:DNA-binding transcriptional MerR regulator
MIGSLDPEIRSNMHLIAKEEVEVDRLRSRVNRMQDKLQTARSDMMRLKSDLENDKQYYIYANRRYSRNQVKIDLVNRLNRAKTNDATLENLTKVLDARENGLDAARLKLEGMLASKRQLAVEIEQLESRQKMVEVAQTTSAFVFDDSQLGRTRELLNDIATRIEVDEKMLAVTSDVSSEIPMSEDAEIETEDITDQVARYLGIQSEVQPEIASVAEIDLN